MIGGIKGECDGDDIITILDPFNGQSEKTYASLFGSVTKFGIFEFPSP